MDEDVLRSVGDEVARCSGPVMVILDDDHAAGHVGRELEAYCGFVTPGSYMLVQDGVIDVLRRFAADRPGPLPAIREFLAVHPEYAADQARSQRFPVTHHPMGWLRRES